MAERLRRINPLAEVEAVKLFYQAETSEDLLDGNPDFVVDAIDQFTAKCHLIATCKDETFHWCVQWALPGDGTRQKSRSWT